MPFRRMAWVEPGWNKKKQEIVTEQFNNFRALNKNTDRYCRQQGGLNPSGNQGHVEMANKYTNGYDGLKKLPAVKKYLTDTYNTAIDSTRDLNVADAQGGRQTSWNKCFGIPIQPRVAETSARYEPFVNIPSSYLIDSMKQPNPGLSPVYSFVEVGTPQGPRNPWSGIWNTNAPPVGNGVQWIWGTSDAYISTPPNQSYSFYYNFLYYGEPFAATVVGSIDNFGYVVINGQRSADIVTTVGPYQATIVNGLNTVEIRGVNISGPAGVWLTISDPDNNIIVKTNSDGWKCTRFFYPAETFGIGNYVFSQQEASSICSAVGSKLATTAQLANAQAARADWCSTGWVSDNANALYPSTTNLIQGCGNGAAGIKTYTPPYRTTGVTCYGNKPEQGALPLLAPGVNSRGGVLLPFRYGSWSQFGN
jgi:Extracellular link domain